MCTRNGHRDCTQGDRFYSQLRRIINPDNCEHTLEERNLVLALLKVHLGDVR